MTTLKLNDNQEIICPNCGFDHIYKTEARITADQVEVTYCCESCGRKSRLQLEAYKGRVRLSIYGHRS